MSGYDVRSAAAAAAALAAVTRRGADALSSWKEHPGVSSSSGIGINAMLTDLDKSRFLLLSILKAPSTPVDALKARGKCRLSATWKSR